MTEGLDDFYQRLSLTEGEQEEVLIEGKALEDASSRSERCLFTQLLTSKHYNRDALFNTMRKIWCPGRRVWFRELSSTTMLIEFEDASDKRKVLREGPWSFDKCLLLVGEVDEN